MQIQVLSGRPFIQPGSTRVNLDPSTHKMVNGAIYELVYHVPNWPIIGDIITAIMTWWKENVEGVDVLGSYREGDNLIFQIRKRAEATVKTPRGLAIITTALAIILGLAAILILFGVVFLAFGLRLAAAGLALIAGGVLAFMFASGYYKLLGVPLIGGGAYLIVKQFMGI